MSQKKTFMSLIRNEIIFNLMETMRWLFVRKNICFCS